ncbi:MAG TPA: CDGSH iron-sulfur domain-containing protein [Solirubrobacteraceae bacterium]|jgi:CDGSH-type Zn-finger protein|nr:CDGSH iron-sulfur domain-containing protein [Solirubrobacteraceae bacterium]
MDEVTITPYRDGPLLIRGPFRLQDQQGREIAADRETVALCRCGRSRIRPFCDGSHKLVHFRAPSELEARGSGDASSSSGDTSSPSGDTSSPSGESS